MYASLRPLSILLCDTLTSSSYSKAVRMCVCAYRDVELFLSASGSIVYSLYRDMRCIVIFLSLSLRDGIINRASSRTCCRVSRRFLFPRQRSRTRSFEKARDSPRKSTRTYKRAVRSRSGTRETNFAPKGYPNRKPRWPNVFNDVPIGCSITVLRFE